MVGLDRPDIVLEKRGSLSMHLVRSFAIDLMPYIAADPDRFFDLPGCEVIKDQKKTKVARAKLKIQGDLKTIYLKRYNTFSWRRRLGSLFQVSRGLKSLNGAAILSEAGIPTPRPLAAVDSRSWGMLDKSFYLSEEIKEGKTADAYWREQLLPMEGLEGMRRRQLFLGGIGELFRSLHAQNVYHNDLKDANILVSSDSSVGCEHYYLLDLEGIRRYRKLNRRRQTKNLVQLNRTLGKYLRATDKLRFLKSYLGPSFSDRINKRDWSVKILQQSGRLDRRRHIEISPMVIPGKPSPES